jgi:hypothetical protein
MTVKLLTHDQIVVLKFFEIHEAGAMRMGGKWIWEKDIRSNPALAANSSLIGPTNCGSRNCCASGRPNGQTTRCCNDPARSGRLHHHRRMAVHECISDCLAVAAQTRGEWEWLKKR